jgi:hypothetical protein
MMPVAGPFSGLRCAERCLPEHRPLGGVSRARRQVYQALSTVRHERNQAPLLSRQQRRVHENRSRSTGKRTPRIIVAYALVRNARYFSATGNPT